MPTPKKLTRKKFTAKNAVFVTKQRRGCSGECTPDAPWGDQCGGVLPDGTHVPRDLFVLAVLHKLAGDTELMEKVIVEWHRKMDVMRALRVGR